MERIKVEDLRRHFYTVDDRGYDSTEICENVIDGLWIPYKEYQRVLIQLVKLKNKLKVEQYSQLNLEEN